MPPTTTFFMQNLVKNADPAPPPGASEQYPGDTRLGNNYTPMPGVNWYNSPYDRNKGPFNIKVIDKENNIKISGEDIIYYKNEEKIISKGSTTIDFNGEYLINTSDIVYLKKENIIKSEKVTTLEDNFENKFSAENFTFSVLDKIFKSKKINLLDSEKNNYSFKESMVNIKTKEVIGKDIEINFRNDVFGNSENEPRLKGNYALSNKEETIIKGGIFTTCKKNKKKCPPWTIKSAEIKHDKKNQIINYKNAWLQVYDKPIFYFPKFFHPDPSVKRKSGFLIPQMGNSSSSGVSFQIPYYHVISDNKDFTFKPNIYFNNDIMLQNATTGYKTRIVEGILTATAGVTR